MVAPVFEHITAIMVVGMLFVSAVIAVPAISYVNLLYVDQQQLRNVTLEALNSMLLGMGYPSNWGSDFNNIDRFGLALSESSSFYVLDPEKVGRLLPNPSGNLNYENVSTLLGLQDYGFNIRIMPLFDVTVENRSQGSDLLFDVTVTFNDGRLIPNAYVDATILYVLEAKSNENTFNFDSTLGNRTNELGECTIGYTLPGEFIGYTLVLKVTVAYMATVTVSYIEGFAQNVANASIIGDTANLWIPEEDWPGSARTIYNVTIVTPEEVRTYEGEKLGEPYGKMTPGVGFQYWFEELTGISYENVLFLIFNIRTQEGPGQKHFVLFVASPLLDVRSGLLQLEGQPSAQSSNSAIKLTRSVEILDMTYIFEMLLWKKT